MSFLKNKYMLLFGIGLALCTSCIAPVQQSWIELASFLRNQSTRTAVTSTGKVFVTVSGLEGSGLVLTLNDSENLNVNSNGEVFFETLIAQGAAYTVIVKTQPTNPTQSCSVSGGTGTLVSGDIKSIVVNCSTTRYTLGGSISGLLGTGLVLTNNGTDTVSISADGTFAFTTTYNVGATYSVVVTSSPIHPTQSCTITNGSGSFTSSNNVTSLSISCTTTGRAIRVNVSGIASGNLILSNNNSDSLTVTSNGSFVFPTDVAIGSGYSVTVTSSPSSHVCSLSSATGTISTSDATVTANCFSLLAQTPANFSVLNTNQSIVFRFSAAITNTSCTYGTGNLTTGGAATFSVSTTNLTNDTLTLSTSTTWNPASVTQTFTCTSAAGNSLASGQITVRYTIPSSTKHVSTATGSDANPGTAASPYATIQFAIAAMNPCGTPPCVILVEDGTYETTTNITVYNNISLYGGYTPSTSFATRNSSARQTIIQKSTPTDCGGALFSGPNPCPTLRIDPAVTNATYVDGFKIIGATDSNETVAVSVITGKVILSNNTIQGGTGNKAAGLFLSNFGGANSSDTTMGAILNNTITGGSCTPVSCETYGIFYFSSSGGLFPFIQSNTVTGGTCTSLSCKSYGFYLGTAVSPDLTLIRYNTINGGTLSSSLSGSESVGFHINNNTVSGKIYGNSINSGTAETSVGVSLGVAIASFSLGDNSIKSGNTIYGGVGGIVSYGVRMPAGGKVFSNSIHGGNVTSASSATTRGIYSASGFVAITNNRIYGGNATATGSSAAFSYGLDISSPAVSSNVEGNHISSGNSRNNGTNNAFTFGAYFNSVSSSLTIYNNMIDGGNCSLANSTYTCRSLGLALNQNSFATEIFYNTIYSGVAEDISIPLYFLATSSQNANVQNNILYTEVGASTRTCLVNDGLTEATNLSNLRGNVFYGCPTLVKYPSTTADNICSGGVVSDGACGTSSISTISTLNVYVDPRQSVTTTTYSMKFRNYSSSSPCTATRILNTLGTPAYDIFNAARPGSVAGISAGAIEYDGTCQ